MEQIKLLFSGDFAPLIKPIYISDNHFGGLSDLFSGIDLHITNLESPLTLEEKSIEKTGPAIKAHPETIELLKQANVDIACLANNHIFDYGEIGLQNTISVCEENEIDITGIVNRSGGQKPWLIREIKGKRIGFLNYCEHEFSVRDGGELGANGYDHIKCFYDILEVRPAVDFLIVIYHGGNEYYPLPRPGLKKVFHYLADLGADAVIGHHTHVISGYEMYMGKPLVYSLGNFFFPFAGEQKEWYTGLLCLITITNKTDFEVIPLEQCLSSLRVQTLNLSQQEIFRKKVSSLSEVINDDNLLLNRWTDFVNLEGEAPLKLLSGYTYIQKVLLKLRLLNKERSNGERRRLIRNLLRNQSLHELLISSTNKSKK